MPGWFWPLTILLGVFGVGLFAISSRRYHAHGRENMTGWDVMAGLAGLGLGAWGALLAVIGGVIELAQVLS